MTRSMFQMLGELQQAWLVEQQRAWQRIMSLPRVFALSRETRVGTTAHDVVLETRTLRLLRYRRETPTLYAEPLLLCYALINRPYILDLQPDKSVVRRYLERGFDVYLIDWRIPTYADRELRLEDYAGVSLSQVFAHLLEQSEASAVHLLGYCMGGTLSVMFAALNPGLLKTLTLLAAPIDFSGQESLLNLWTDPKYFDVDAFVEAHGNCPAAFLQACFTLMKPVQNLLEKQIAFCESMDDPRFVASFFAMERWVNDNVPVAGETFRQFVKRLYQGNELVRGTFSLDGRALDLACITCPLLLLTATNDHLVPPGSTERIQARVGSQEVQLMTLDAGHVGLVVGRKAQTAFWPQATDWLARHSALTAGARADVHEARRGPERRPARLEREESSHGA